MILDHLYGAIQQIPVSLWRGVLSWSGVEGADITGVVTTSLTIVGADTKSFSLQGSQVASFSLVGTDTKNYSLTGA